MVTLAAKGAYYANGIGDKGHVEAEKDINVLDATGAGYSYLILLFFLSFLSALMFFLAIGNQCSRMCLQ